MRRPAPLSSNGRECYPVEYVERLEQRIAELTVQRSISTHNHQFAEIAQMWQTLPEWLDAPYTASADALRKHALIATGHCDTSTAAFSNGSDAIAAYDMMRKAVHRDHGYGVLRLTGNTLMVATPHSQSMRAMGKRRFQKSKEDVLRWIGDLLESARQDEAA